MQLWKSRSSRQRESVPRSTEQPPANLDSLRAAIPPRSDSLIDFERTFEVARERAAEYRAATPFPHVVIDEFLPPASLDRVIGELLRLDDRLEWGDVNCNLPDGRPAQYRKYHLQHVLHLPPLLRQLLWELNSGAFLMILEWLTGISTLLSDPQLEGGGIHVVGSGGLLRVHADFSKHPVYGLDRRLNLLLYCNPEWREEWGGHLELWSQDMKRCDRRILPIANRCVIFNTTRTSYHGHPHPLACPNGIARRTVATYYYSVPGSGEARPRHGTLWQDLPSERGGDGHSR